MRHMLRMSNRLELVTFDDVEWSLEFTVSSAEVADCCCELLLLLLGKASRVALVFNHGAKLSVSISGTKSTVTKLDRNDAILALTQRDAELVLSYLASWYRDGVDPVRHLDIELKGPPKSNSHGTLVISSDVAVPPLSAEEVERELGD